MSPTICFWVLSAMSILVFRRATLFTSCSMEQLVLGATEGTISLGEAFGLWDPRLSLTKTIPLITPLARCGHAAIYLVQTDTATTSPWHSHYNSTNINSHGRSNRSSSRVHRCTTSIEHTKVTSKHAYGVLCLLDLFNLVLSSACTG